MNSILSAISHPVLDAVGMALLHSLWQGALVGAGLVLALRLAKYAAPNVRYTMCAAALLLFFLLPVSTAWLLYVPATPQTTMATGEAVQFSLPVAPTPVPEAASVPPEVEGMMHTTPWNVWLVAFWFAGVMVCAMRLMWGMATVYRVKHSGILIHDPSFQRRYAALMKAMGIARPVVVRIADQVDQPMLIGWLKPVILLPASMLANMAPEHVEAILAHELAHVRRHDYLVACLQSLMEALFFYHPVTWWISRQMRIEREYCCDEIALEAVNNDVVYASALAALEAPRVARHQHALGARDGRLVDRIRHVVHRRHRKSPRQRSSWLVAALLLLSCTAIVTACLDRPETMQEENDTGEALLMAAIEAGKQRDYPEAVRYAEQAADKGELCSRLFLSQIYYPGHKGFVQVGGARMKPVDWEGENLDLAKQWAEDFRYGLLEEAEQGNSAAMLFVSHLYLDNWLDSPFEYVEGNDSLGTVWLQRAAEADNPLALNSLGRRTKDREEAKRLYQRAARLGDGSAYMLWAFNVINDKEEFNPEGYFAIASEALDNQADGIHEWLGRDLAAMKKQAERGNEEAIAWKAIADSLNLYERFENTPDNRVNFYPTNRGVCEWDWLWRYDEIGS